MIQDIAPHRLENPYKSDAVADSGSILFAFRGGEVLLRRDEEDNYTLPRVGEFPDIEGNKAALTYLFSLDGVECYLSESAPEPEEGYTYIEIRKLRNEGGIELYCLFAAVTAFQLSHWYDYNRFCGHCGNPLEKSDRERALVCPNCGHTVYPRIVPAVSVAVTDGDKLLLTKYANRRMTFYALVAGFTEIGETLEETVQREVMEEVGLKVKNIRYYKSQPWGFVDDLMVGFFCDVDGSRKIRLDKTELKEAVWLPRDEIVGQPDDFALTNEMMMLFSAGKEPKA
ncbi:MAG: NAD(+) diphosphatase [Lachnospiraceae bacterium]|nr:NAD(+) diphosphatase [Lachnospiraceae bacterium]